MIRLDKYLSDLEFASRRELKSIIKSGRVSLNGRPVTVPETAVDPEEDEVVFDGRPLSYVRYRYFAMDKPAGVLTACKDGRQQTVIDLLPPEIRAFHLFPVGRLDKDTSGLLLLTNDGEYAHRVISPKYEIEKRYYAVTEGIPTEKDAAAFASGLVLRDGLHCLPAELKITGENRCEVLVREGKYHQVRRMLASVGKPVTELRRLSIGALALSELSMSGSNSTYFTVSPDSAESGICAVCELSQEQKNLVFAKK